MKKVDLQNVAKEEINNVVEGLIGENEKIEVVICGTDMKNVYGRLATTPVTMVVPFGLATNPMVTKSQEYQRLYFTNEGIIVMGLDYFKRYLNSEKISYDDVKEVLYHEDGGLLELKTADDHYTLKVSDYAKENLLEKVEKLVTVKHVQEKYNGKTKKMFNKVLAAEYVAVAVLFCAMVGGMLALMN